MSRPLSYTARAARNYGLRSMMQRARSRLIEQPDWHVINWPLLAINSLIIFIAFCVAYALS